ncbi:MAG: S8 family serine peptidase [Bacteroidales bacterium]|nr:S8 family serine peptidase [Bacteroidales bacterium]
MAVLPLLLTGCDGRTSLIEDTPLPASVIGCPDNADNSRILVQTDDISSAADGFEYERLFPSTPGKESIEHRYGLDSWFVVTIPEGMEAREVAGRLSKSEAVRSIEFCAALTDPSERDDMTVCDIAPMTKSAAEPVSMNDPLFKSQWFLFNNGDKSTFGQTCVAGCDVNIKDAWSLCAGDPSIIVAVVDEGVKYTHPDLEANMWTNTGEIPGNGIDDDRNGYVDDIHGYNFIDDGPISWNKGGDNGHGTHVAGLVAAVNNNGIGISSVAGGSGKGDGVRIMSCQIFSGSSHDNAAVAKAIKYAADNGASVLQCSFGLGKYYSDRAFSESLSAVKAAFDYFRAPENANNSAVDGNIVIISAGNSHNNFAEYPGAYRDYICVSAISQDNLPAWYSNYGLGVNIAAPGGDNTFTLTMLSTLPSELKGNDYGFMHGTSQATPVVSGIAALGLSYAKQLGRHFTRDEFEAMILTAVNPLEDRLSGSKMGPTSSFDLASRKGGMGTGVIDAWKMLMNVEGVPFVTVKTGTDASIDLRRLLGEDAAKIAIKEVSISSRDSEALGLKEAPAVSQGILHINCSKMGSARITVEAVAGGAAEGTDTDMGGKLFKRTISIVSRENASNNGGWL